MNDREKRYFMEYMYTLIGETKGKKSSLLLLKHHNSLYPEEEDLRTKSVERRGYQIVYHPFLAGRMLNPYEPFLDSIKEYVCKEKAKENGFDINEFLDRTQVYSLHRRLFLSYFEGDCCHRTEDLLIGEYEYEKQKMRNAIVHMIAEISAAQPLLFVLCEANLAGLSFWQLLSDFLAMGLPGQLKFVVLCNVSGSVPSFAQKEQQRFLQMCEKEGLSCDWIYETDDDTAEPAASSPSSMPLEQRLLLLHNTSFFLEMEQTNYYIQAMSEKTDLPAAANASLHLKDFYQISIWSHLCLANYSDILFVCDRMKQISFEDPDDTLRIRFLASYYKTLASIYNHEIAINQEALRECKKYGIQLGDEHTLFRIELLENMANYSGWKDLWISENDSAVSPQLIAWCEKYEHWNHLAHIYAYSFNSDYHNLQQVEGIDERIAEFNKGIALGQKIGNEQFLKEAYQKNIMIASIHGYFDVCIYFYKKTLGILENKGTELTKASLFNGLGYSNCGLGNYAKANEYYNRALVIFYNHKKIDEVIETLYNMGINAILAEDIGSARAYLLEAADILQMLKQTFLRCCNISKLYGLISLACFRKGVIYQSLQYLNSAKHFLGHILGTENERDIIYSDDSMFLVYFMDALMHRREQRYQEALRSLDNAQFYMNRSTGAMFFNYPQFALEKSDLLLQLGRKEEGQKVLADCLAYCREHGYEYYVRKMAIHLGEMPVTNALPPERLSLTGLTLPEITNWVRMEVTEKSNREMLKNIHLFNNLQRIINNMRADAQTELASLIPVFKNSFHLDRALLIRIPLEGPYVAYSDLEYPITDDDLNIIVDFFKDRTQGIIMTPSDYANEDCKELLSIFAESRIISLAIIPNISNKILNGILVVLTEMKDNWISVQGRTILDENDLYISHYVLNTISNAIDMLEFRQKLLDANQQMKVQMQQMSELRDAAMAANRAKSNFLANMSHEIRTPINAIIGMNEMILRECRDSAIQNYATDVSSATYALLGIVNDILDMSKIESGKIELLPVNYHLSGMIHDLVSMVSLRAQKKGLHFALKVNPDLPSVLYGDDIRLHQIITNLLTNAVKYTHDGTVTLDIDGTRDGEDVILDVKVIDTGIGIHQEDLPRLFMAFERIDEKMNRNIEGTGLGLNITSQLLFMMDSKLEVQSEYKKGSTFSFRLRQQIVDDTPVGDLSPQPVSPTPQSAYVSSFHAPKARILVVDDKELNRKVFINLLKKTQLVIDEAEGGQESLEMTARQHYDLIFMDHMMPQMDGIEAYHHIKSDPSNPCADTPVVILTANAISGAKEKYMEEGFDNYLSKPIKPEKLEQMIREMLPRDLIETDASPDLEDSPDTETSCKELPELPDFDWQYARLVLQDDDLIRQTALQFYKSIDGEIRQLEEYLPSIRQPEVLEKYRIEVHSLKSTAKMLGCLSLSGLAKAAEYAAKKEDYSRIEVLTPILIEEMKDQQESLSELDEGSASRETVTDWNRIALLAQKLKKSLEDWDLDESDALIAELGKYHYEEPLQKMVEEMDTRIRNLEMQQASAMLEPFLAALPVTVFQ